LGEGEFRIGKVNCLRKLLSKIGLLNKNITGTLRQTDGSPVVSALLRLHSTGLSYKGYTVRVKDGHFAVRLPDGMYLIEGYWDEATRNQIQLQYPFAVSQGKSKPDPLSLYAAEDNVSGTLQLEDGTPIDGVYLNLHSENIGKENYSYGTKVKQGRFSLFLADGRYSVDGYSDPVTQKKVQLRYALNVVNGEAKPNPLTITVMKDNVFGTFKMQDGVLFDQAVIRLRCVGSKTSQNTAYSIQVVQGRFAAYLPDGRYVLEGFFNPHTVQDTPLRFDFTVSEGKTVPESLDIVVMNPNVFGTFTENGEKPDNVYLKLINRFADQHLDAEMNVNVRYGQFAIYLPDGSYTIESYADPVSQKQVPIGYDFSVTECRSCPHPLSVWR
jgi:hypothetical protein